MQSLIIYISAKVYSKMKEIITLLIAPLSKLIDVFANGKARKTDIMRQLEARINEILETNGKLYAEVAELRQEVHNLTIENQNLRLTIAQLQLKFEGTCKL